KEDNIPNIQKNKTTEVKDQINKKKLDQTNKSKNKNEKDKDSELKEEIENLKEEKLRLLAEMENLRKRSERDKIDSIKYGSINLARDILSPSDNLSRAIEAIPSDEKISESINNLIDGLKMIQKEFMTILERHGVERIEAINNKFDHNYHQAMLEVEKDNCEEGIVVQEIQSGFTMHGRLLRPSMVGVSKKSENTKKNIKKD
ncbi:uncharacterized protein METZ01_LOCUS341678, partial [marine metagenome]